MLDSLGPSEVAIFGAHDKKMMSTYSLSQQQVYHWMLAQMATYPDPDQAHYNALYPTNAGAQQLLDPAQQEQMQYSSMSQPLYPKVETSSTATPDEQSASSSQQIHRLSQDLQQHAAIEEQKRYHAQHQTAHQHMQPHQLPVVPQAQLQQAASDQTPKPNRLRKACDSCSIRKVKVLDLTLSNSWLRFLTCFLVR